MWPVLVEFRSPNSKGIADEKKKKKKIEEDRIEVKPKSADKYVGWPNRNNRSCNWKIYNYCNFTLKLRNRKIINANWNWKWTTKTTLYQNIGYEGHLGPISRLYPQSVQITVSSPVSDLAHSVCVATPRVGRHQ